MNYTVFLEEASRLIKILYRQETSKDNYDNEVENFLSRLTVEDEVEDEIHKLILQFAALSN